jgi:hypothetical protein
LQVTVSAKASPAVEAPAAGLEPGLGWAQEPQPAAVAESVADPDTVAFRGSQSREVIWARVQRGFALPFPRGRVRTR